MRHDYTTTVSIKTKWIAAASVGVVGGLMLAGVLYGIVFYHLPIYRYFAANMVHGIHPLTLTLVISGLVGLFAGFVVLALKSPETLGRKLKSLCENKTIRKKIDGKHVSISKRQIMVLIEKSGWSFFWLLVFGAVGTMVGILSATCKYLWLSSHIGDMIHTKPITSLFLQHILMGLIIGCGIALLRNAFYLPDQKTEYHTLEEKPGSKPKLWQNLLGSFCTLVMWFMLFSTFGLAFSLLPINALVPHFKLGILGNHLSYALLTATAGAVFIGIMHCMVKFNDRGRWMQNMVEHIKQSSKSMAKLVCGFFFGGVSGLLISFTVIHLYSMAAVIQAPMLIQAALSGVIFGSLVALVVMNFLSMTSEEEKAHHFDSTPGPRTSSDLGLPSSTPARKQDLNLMVEGMKASQKAFKRGRR